MKLRTKAFIFLGPLFLVIILAVAFYAQYIVGAVFKKQTIDHFRSIAEQTESAYFAFVENMKTRALDWASDSTLRNLSKGILDTPRGSFERARLEKEFAAYVSEKKMPFDKTIFLTDLLDHEGTVIASTDPKRIGHDEGSQEFSRKSHNFTKTINSTFGEAFTKGIVTEAYESPSPVIRATARIAVPDKDGVFQPIDAVLLIHFSNMEKIAAVLRGGGLQEGRQTSESFIRNSQTSDIYLVNSEKFLVTPSRSIKDVKVNQKIDTLPVRECFERGLEVSDEYENYQGTRVLGASMCLQDDGLVLIVEIDKDEVYAPMTSFVRRTAIGGVGAIFLGFLLVALFVRRPIDNLNDVVLAAERAAKGDLGTLIEVRTKDEIGYLASVLNSMITSIRNSQEELQASKENIEIKAHILEEDLKEHEKQQQFLMQSKKATLNLLEDSWNVGEKLQAESNKLQTIISSIGDGLILIDGGYKIVLLNPRAVEMFAMPRQDVIGKDLREVMKLWKKKKDEILPAQWPIEEMFLTKSVVTTTLEDELSLTTVWREKQIPVVLSVSPLGGGIPGGVIVIHDVTADRELYDAKSGFISVASHQLRTPLTSIRWYSEMLLSNDVGPLNEAQKDFMIEVHDGAERLYRTVDLLLGISRIESGKIKAEKVPIDLGAFTGEIVKELSSQIDEKKIVLSVFPPEGGPVVVPLDSLTLRQVVLNLLSNAIRYTNEDNGIIEVRWNTDEAGKEVKYSVRDNGIGIPEAQRSRIFSKFFRAENALAHVPDGSGLGLALVKELVESWGGKVWFETEERKGSTFFFTVPLV